MLCRFDAAVCSPLLELSVCQNLLDVTAERRTLYYLRSESEIRKQSALSTYTHMRRQKHKTRTHVMNKMVATKQNDTALKKLHLLSSSPFHYTASQMPVL